MKSIFIIFEGLSLQEIKTFFFEVESLNLTGQDKQGVRHKTKSKETYI